MSSESEFVLNAWELFKPFVPEKKREEVAAEFLRILVEYGIDLDDLEEIDGEDDILDIAIAAFDDEKEEEPEF